MKLIRTIVLILVVAGVAIVADRTYRARTDPLSAEWIEDARFDKIVIDHLRFDHEPLSSALRKLSDKSGVGVMLDSQELESHGLDSETSVSVTLEHVNLNEALDQILRAVNVAGRMQLDYTLDRESILVSTAAKLERYAILRIYSIDDIVRAIDAKGIPDVAPPVSNRQFFLFNGPDRLTDQDAIDSVCKLIEDTVDPDSWKDNGGLVGAIRELNHRLFIQTTWRKHQEVARLLRAIRVAAAPNPPASGQQ